MSENLTSNYIITNYETSVSERRSNVETPQSGELLLQFEEEFFVLSDYSGGQLYIDTVQGNGRSYFFDTSGTSGSTGDNLTIGSSNYVVVQISACSTESQVTLELSGAIASANGHNGEIITQRTNENFNSYLKLIQSQPGVDAEIGDPYIELEFSSGWPYPITTPGNDWNFIIPTGSSFEDLVAAPFRISTNTTNNLRGQTTTSRYKVFLGEEK